MPRKNDLPNDVIEETTATKTVSQKENQDVSPLDDSIEEKYQVILNNIDSFNDNDFEHIDDYARWQSLFSQYEEISNQIIAFSADEKIPEAIRKVKAGELYGELSAIYDDFYLSFTKWNIVHVKTMEDKMEKTQVMNFTVFSIFMTILTFLLSNIVVASRTDFDLKKMVITNLTLLLVASVLFLFIGTFLGFVGKGNGRFVKFLKTFLLFVMPVIIATALVLVTIFME